MYCGEKLYISRKSSGGGRTVFEEENFYNFNNLNNQIIASKNVYWRTSASIWCKVYSWVPWGVPGGGPGGGAAGGGQLQDKKSNLFFLVF